MRVMYLIRFCIRLIISTPEAKAKRDRKYLNAWKKSKFAKLRPKRTMLPVMAFENTPPLVEKV